MSLQITPNAAKRLLQMNKGSSDRMLRVLIDPGGCHGFQYKMDLTDIKNQEDTLFERDGAKVIVDPTTLDMIKGSKLDYVEELIGSAFQVIDNPRAETSCGCKISFNLKE